MAFFIRKILIAIAIAYAAFVVAKIYQAYKDHINKKHEHHDRGDWTDF